MDSTVDQLEKDSIERLDGLEAGNQFLRGEFIEMKDLLTLVYQNSQPQNKDKLPVGQSATQGGVGALAEGKVRA